MPTEDNHCAHCNKIRALPDSPTKMYMELNHLLDLGHQAGSVEAPKGEHSHTNDAGIAVSCDCDKTEPAKPPAQENQFVWCNGLWDTAHTTTCGNQERHEPHWVDPAKPPESEILAQIQRRRNAQYMIFSSDKEALNAAIEDIHWLLHHIEADAQRLKEANEHIQVIAEAHRETKIRLLEAIKRAQKAERECDELRRDRARWVKVCAERDATILRLRDELGVFLNLPYAEQKQVVSHRRELVQRIKDYARQHTQYPFANAIIDLCNQVLEPK